MEIVTNHGMPVRWSTAHYRFSRAPCTATLYRRPSLTRSFTSFCLSSSQSTSITLSPEFPSLFPQSSSLLALSLSLCHGHSYPFVRLLLLTRAYSSSEALCPNSQSMSLLVSRTPSLSWYDNRVLSLCPSSLSSPSSTPNVPPRIALSPSDSVSLHLLTIFLLSLPFDLSSPSSSRYDSSARSIQRSSNSTTYRQIKFVLARRKHHI